jgi:hypothetical protein
MLAAREFLLLMGLGFIVAGLTTYVMTWILVVVHLRDKHPQERQRLGGFLFSPHAFTWFLARWYRKLGDRMLDGVARMGFIGAWGILFGIASCAASKVLGLLGAGL